MLPHAHHRRRAAHVALWLLCLAGCALEHPSVRAVRDARVPEDVVRRDVPPSPDVPVFMDVPAVDVPGVDVPMADASPVDVAESDPVETVDVPPVDVPPVDVAPVDVSPVDVPSVDVAPVDSGPTCPPGRTFCGGGCRDISIDTGHCGACDRACGAGQMCVRGNCSTCGMPGQTCCEGGGCAAGASCVGVTNRCAACGGAGQRCCGGITGSCGGGLTCLPVDLVVSYCVDLTGGGGNPGRGCQSGDRCDTGYVCRAFLASPVRYCIQCGQLDQPCCGSDCMRGSCVATYCL